MFVVDGALGHTFDGNDRIIIQHFFIRLTWFSHIAPRVSEIQAEVTVLQCVGSLVSQHSADGAASEYYTAEGLPNKLRMLGSYYFTLKLRAIRYTVAWYSTGEETVRGTNHYCWSHLRGATTTGNTL